MKVVAKAAAFFVLLAISGLLAQDDRSLTDFESRPSRGYNVPIPAPNADIGSLEEQLVLARASITALTEALALANNEAEVFKRQAADLQLKLDAYGLTGFEEDPGKIEARLLTAVRDLRVLKKQNEDALNQLVRLSEALQILIKSTEGINPQARASVEIELRKTREILGASSVPNAQGVEVTLNDGMIVSLKENLSLVVANIGTKHGVKIGMPFQVWREDRYIGEVRVVEVRDNISGAVIQNLKSEKEPIKIGDRLRVDSK